MTLFAISVADGHNHSNVEATKHPKECPLWFHYNSTLQECQCSQSSMFTCDGQDVFVGFDHLTTYNKSKEIVSLSSTRNCRFLYYNSSLSNMSSSKYILLPKNNSQLNNFSCGPLNRKGSLCRDCIDGYGLTINLMGCKNKCYKCTMKHWQGVAVYIVVEIIPLTLFYVFVLVFRISVISAPMTCFILYSQILIITVYTAWNDILLGQVIHTQAGELRSVTKLLLTLYGVFNLDFFRHTLPPFCISTHLTPLQRVFLGYISAFYPLILIFLTWFCIKLHNNNFKTIVVLWRPFHRCFVQARKGWNTRNDLINVFASFLLLSNCKIIYQTLLVSGTTMRHDFSMRALYLSWSYVLGADISIPISSVEYIVSTTFASLVTCVFNVIPLLLLVLYPVRIFRKVLSKCRLDGLGPMIFVEKFHSSYRDGLNGGKDMRSFSGLYFLLQAVVLTGPLVVNDLLDFEQWFLHGTCFSVVALVIALCRPYKKMINNISDALLLFHMAVIGYILSSDTESEFFVPFMQTLLLIPFVVFGLLVALRVTYKLHQYLCCSKVAVANFIESERQQLIQPDYQ